jgi:hypothetical protein
MWSSGKSSWLQIRKPRARFSGTTMGEEVVGLERGPLSLLSATEELLGRNNSGSGLEAENTAVGIRNADHVAPYTRQKLALTSLTSSGHSVGIVRLRTEATEFFLLFVNTHYFILSFSALVNFLFFFFSFVIELCFILF